MPDKINQTTNIASKDVYVISGNLIVLISEAVV